MVTSNDLTLVVSSKPCQGAQTGKTIHVCQYLLVLSQILTYATVMGGG